MATSSAGSSIHGSTVIWVDRWHALVARSKAGQPQVTEVDRAFDAEVEYLDRVVHAAADCDRLVVLGPDASRIAFEREYVTLYRRPDRLIDAGASMEPSPIELVDRLRFLEPSFA